MIAPHHAKIVEALKVLGNATYEEIASRLTMDRHAIGRRLKEMELLNLVYKPGNKKLTKSGRAAYCYSLCTGEKTDNQVKEGNIYKKGEKTAADYASALINSVKQPTLF